MFTLEQINDIRDRLGNAETLPQYLEALKNIGVDNYDSFITDGHSEYFGIVLTQDIISGYQAYDQAKNQGTICNKAP